MRECIINTKWKHEQVFKYSYFLERYFQFFFHENRRVIIYTWEYCIAMQVCSLKISGPTLLINGNNEAVSIVPWSWPPVSSRGDTRDQTCKRCLAMFVVESKSKILNKSLRSYLGTNVSTNCLYLRFEHLSLFNSIPNFIKHRLHVWSWLIGGGSPLPLTMMTVTLSGHLASPPSVLATSGGQQGETGRNWSLFYSHQSCWDTGNLRRTLTNTVIKCILQILDVNIINMNTRH